MCRAHSFAGPAMPGVGHVERRNPLFRQTSSSSLESWDGEAPGSDDGGHAAHDCGEGQAPGQDRDGAHAAAPYPEGNSKEEHGLRVRTYTTGYDAYGHVPATPHNSGGAISISAPTPW